MAISNEWNLGRSSMKSSREKNNGPVGRQDALEMQPSDVMFYFHWFLQCFWEFFMWLYCVIPCFFSKKWTKFKWHHSFVHVARGYSEMHVFKCRWCFRHSEMAFLQRLTYFFFDFDFSHSNYIIVHGATAKCMFLMEIVVSPQRNTII